MTRYERRIIDLEALGMSTSDAQGCLDAEIMQLAETLKSELKVPKELIKQALESFFETKLIL